MTTIPAAPSLEQLRRRAKDLLRDHCAGDPDARRRVAEHHPDPPEPLKLTAAQLVVAREHGFASWPRMKAYVERVTAHGPDLEHPFHEDLDYYEGRAEGLRASAEDGTPGAVAAFTETGVPLTEAGARAVVARRHGFASWAALRRHVASLRDGGEPFARAYRALEGHDLEGLREQLDRFPGLATARGTNGNDLLGMAGATGDERLVALLLERGADPRSANAHGWTALHQVAYSNQPSLARRMLDAGARPEISARGDGGTPLVVALFWATSRRPSCSPRRVGSTRATCAPPPAWAASTSSTSSSPPTARCARRPARTAPSTAPTAAFRTGRRPTTRPRSATRR